MDADISTSMKPSSCNRNFPCSNGRRNGASTPGIGTHSSWVCSSSVDVPFDTIMPRTLSSGGLRLPLPSLSDPSKLSVKAVLLSLVSFSRWMARLAPGASEAGWPPISRSPAILIGCSQFTVADRDAYTPFTLRLTSPSNAGVVKKSASIGMGDQPPRCKMLTPADPATVSMNPVA